MTGVQTCALPILPGSRVSIHAPVRGATDKIDRLQERIWFQSTPLCEGRQHHSLFSYCSVQFQSTPLCEGRPMGTRSSGRYGAFQSTPLCEGRLGFISAVCSLYRFQSTPLCEGRLFFLTASFVFVSFNPRPYARGDGLRNITRPPICVSIHAPVRGATRLLCC